MKPALKSRTIRAEIVLVDGTCSDQTFEVEGADDAELQRASGVFAQGVLTVVAMIPEDEILSLCIGWADVWPLPSAHRFASQLSH